MLNGNGFATSRSPMSLGGDVFSSWIVRTSFSYYAVSRLQRVSSLPNEEPVGAMYAWLQAERRRFRVSCASACSELMVRKLVASLSCVQIAADEFGHMLQTGEGARTVRPWPENYSTWWTPPGADSTAPLRSMMYRFVCSRTTRMTVPWIQSE